MTRRSGGLKRGAGGAGGLLLLLALLRPASAMIIDKVVAVVNQEVITLSELQEEVEPVLREITDQYVGAERDRRLREMEERLLKQLIDRRLQYQEAKRQKITVSPAEVTNAIEDLKRKNKIETEQALQEALAREKLTLDHLRRNIEEELSISRLVTKEVRSKVIVGEEEIRAYYEKHREEKYRRSPEARIRHLLVAVPADASAADRARARARAEEALALLRRGEDFAKVAARYSDGPTAATGGELGRMKKSDLAPELAAVAFQLPVGRVSDIIETPAGFNLIQVEERWTDPYRSLAEVREQIRNALVDEKSQSIYKEWLDGLRARASIEVKL